MTQSAPQAELEANKALVKAMLEDVIFNMNYENIEKYCGDPYIQHNPQVDDGTGPLRAKLKEMSDAIKVDGELPEEWKGWKFQRFIAEGNLVVAHYFHPMIPTPGRGGALIDIFRVENGKIYEHWDAIQEMPEHSENPHPMF